jgi:hypothetical protein
MFLNPRHVLTSALFTLLAASGAEAQGIEVLYTKIDASTTSDIPGTLDLNGQPAASKWRALEDFTVSHDGSRWVLKGRTRLGSDLETILVLGHGATGTALAENLAQEGQPVPGDTAGILWDFFDSGSPASFDSLNNIGLSARSKGGATGTRERIMKRDLGGSWTIVLREGELLFGLTDTPSSSAGDEALGNSVSGVHLLDDGRVGYIVTPIQNCSSFNYPAFLHDDQGFLQTGASALAGGEIWDGMDLGDSGGTPDGSSFYILGDTENSDTSIDDVFTVDNTVVMREGSPVDGASGPIFDAGFQCMMAASGDWAVRGDDPAGDDWAMVSGALVASTGGSVEGGAELWGASFSSISCNSYGDWALVGTTDAVDTARDMVLVVNGQVLVREGDPVDLDGNGLFDDGVFIGDGTPTSSAFAGNDLTITDDGLVYFIAALNDGAGGDLNDSGFGGPDSFLRVQAATTPPVFAYCFGELGSGTPCPCLNDNDGSVPESGCANGAFASGARLTSSGTASVTADTLVLSTSHLEPNNSGLYFQANNDLSPGLFWGDGLQCAGGGLIRLGVRFSDGSGHSDTSGYPHTISERSATFGHPISAGETLYYQCWYRNVNGSPCGTQFNTSNGYGVIWFP